MKPGFQPENNKLSSLQSRDNPSVEPWKTEVPRLYSPQGFPQTGKQLKSTSPQWTSPQTTGTGIPTKGPFIALSHLLLMAYLSPSPTTLSHLLQMTYVSPFPISINQQCYFMRVQILGTLVFNPLPPLDHEM